MMLCKAKSAMYNLVNNNAATPIKNNRKGLLLVLYADNQIPWSEILPFPWYVLSHCVLEMKAHGLSTNGIEAARPKWNDCLLCRAHLGEPLPFRNTPAQTDDQCLVSATR